MIHSLVLVDSSFTWIANTTTTTAPKTKNGLNPLLAASRILYSLILEKTEEAISRAHEDQEYSMIFGISLNDKISVTISDGKTWTFSVNQLLYGKRLDLKDYTKRADEYAKYMFLNPWIAAQLYFRTRGKYLVDISDCTKMTRTGKFNYDEAFFRIYHVPPKERFSVWHKHSVVPYFFRTDLTLESIELQTLWCYVKSIEEVKELYDKRAEDHFREVQLKKKLASEIKMEKEKAEVSQ
jgi:hypothetical protein